MSGKTAEAVADKRDEHPDAEESKGTKGRGKGGVPRGGKMTGARGGNSDARATREGKHDQSRRIGLHPSVVQSNEECVTRIKQVSHEIRRQP